MMASLLACGRFDGLRISLALFTFCSQNDFERTIPERTSPSPRASHSPSSGSTDFDRSLEPVRIDSAIFVSCLSPSSRFPSTPSILVESSCNTMSKRHVDRKGVDLHPLSQPPASSPRLLHTPSNRSSSQRITAMSTNHVTRNPSFRISFESLYDPSRPRSLLNV